MEFKPEFRRFKFSPQQDREMGSRPSGQKDHGRPWVCQAYPLPACKGGGLRPQAPCRVTCTGRLCPVTVTGGLQALRKHLNLVFENQKHSSIFVQKHNVLQKARTLCRPILRYSAGNNAFISGIVFPRMWFKQIISRCQLKCLGYNR